VWKSPVFCAINPELNQESPEYTQKTKTPVFCGINADLNQESPEYTQKSKAAFTLNGFNNQERILTFVKTDFQALNLKFHAYSFKQTFYSLQKTIYRVTLTTGKYFYTSFFRYLAVKPACVNAT